MIVYRGDVQHRTFTMLWCERCGEAIADPQPPDRATRSLADISGPMACVECGEDLTLLAAFIHPSSTTVIGDGRPRHIATGSALVAAEGLDRA